MLALGLLLSGCYVTHNPSAIRKTTDTEYKKIKDTRDARINILKGDKNLVYVGIWLVQSDMKLRGTDMGWLTSHIKEEDIIIKNIANNKCKKDLNLNRAKKIKTWHTTKEEAKKYNLWLKSYDVFKCEKSLEQINSENVALKSNNTLNRSFVCSYKFNPSEKSKIKIRGKTATEITAVGISINYSIVNLSSKGAFSLQGSSKDGRAWFIGAKSFLLLDDNGLEYNCK